MLNQEQIAAIDAWFSEEVDGGVCNDIFGLVDKMIEHDVISQSDFQNNELQVLYFIDSKWFTCEECGWTQPISEMTNDEEHDWTCTDCNPDVG